jgi:hypothetical protein
MKAGLVLAYARTALVSAFVGLASRPDSCTLASLRWGATPPIPHEIVVKRFLVGEYVETNRSLDRDGLGQVTRLIDVVALQVRHEIRDELHR